jgi:hypothetical protein
VRQNVVMTIGQLRSLNFERPTPAHKQLFDVLRGENLDGEISPVGRVLILAPDLSAALQPSTLRQFRCREESTVSGLPADCLCIWSRSDCASCW